MSGEAFAQRLRECVGDGSVVRDARLAPLTTFGVGGPADWLVTIRSVTELSAVLGAAHEASIPVTVLGGGSNVVVADEGIRGVVLRLQMAQIFQPTPATVRAEAGVTM